MVQDVISLAEVDEIRVTTIMDNGIDILMASREGVERYPMSQRWLPVAAADPGLFANPIPIAEHGFSALIDARIGDRQGLVLFDTGISRNGVLYNMDILEIDPRNLQAIVLSHGHPDHALGLPGLVDRLGKRNVPLVLHPDAYLERKLVLPGGFEIKAPPPRMSDLRQENVELIEETGPSMLVNNMVLVSGEVSRTTDFEKGFPIHYAYRNGEWQPDPMIYDDQCAIINVRDKGLVIISGCGHAGIINIIRNAQAITGVQQIHAVIGGFHLSGGLFEPIIPATVAALKELSPDYLVPGHCTGFSAINMMANEMPDQFIPNSVGTTYIL